MTNMVFSASLVMCALLLFVQSDLASAAVTDGCDDNGTCENGGNKPKAAFVQTKASIVTARQLFAAKSDRLSCDPDQCSAALTECLSRPGQEQGRRGCAAYQDGWGSFACCDKEECDAFCADWGTDDRPYCDSACSFMHNESMCCLSKMMSDEMAAAAPPSEGSSRAWLKLPSMMLLTKDVTKIRSANVDVLSQVAGQARAILPPALFDLGVAVLKNEQTLDAVVANTNFVNVTYAGQPLTMRMVDGDATTFGEPEGSDVYGLSTLNTLTPNAQGMFTMMDVGGNMGVVTLAAYKKVPSLRVVVVEPVPSNYFLLVWNLWLNDVPSLDEAAFKATPTASGVLSLNRGVAAVDGQSLDLCYTPPFTMNARICHCQEQLEVVEHEPGSQTCSTVVSQSFAYLRSLVGADQLTFLKVDCEGCEVDLLPAIDLASGWKLGRLAGELHGVSNAVEDLVCKFEAGTWWVHVCNEGTMQTPGPYKGMQVKDRCPLGATRVSCESPRV